MPHSPTITEAEILEDIIASTRPSLTPEAARSLLNLRFSKEGRLQIRRLLRKNNQGRITAEERIALQKYLRVGQFLDLMQAKAKLLLAQISSPS